MQTVLVAGGAGFIGSHLCKSLLNDNNKVICVDNLITGDRNNIRELLRNPLFEFIEDDITKPVQSSKFKVQSLDYIFHLASPASPNKKSTKSYINHPIETLLVNSLGTYNLLELAKNFGSKFLFASSSEIYGDPQMSPQKETYFGNVNPNGVRSVYDEGKRFGEAMTFGYLRKHNLDNRIIRIFNTYGPKMQVDDGRVVVDFIVQAINGQPFTVHGSGEQTRSFCYVSDMVEGLVKLMFTDKLTGEVVNLGNADERSVNELMDVVAEKFKVEKQVKRLPLPEDDPIRRQPDISKAKKLLSWEPKVNLNEGLNKTIEYFRGVMG